MYKTGPAWASGQKIKRKRNKQWRDQIQTVLADFNMAGVEVMVDIDDQVASITTTEKGHTELVKRLRRQRISQKEFYDKLARQLVFAAAATPSNVRH